MLIGTDLEGDDHAVFRGILPTFVWRTDCKSSVGIENRRGLTLVPPEYKSRELYLLGIFDRVLEVDGCLLHFS
jgi:hypothetical protein